MKPLDGIDVARAHHATPATARRIGSGTCQIGRSHICRIGCSRTCQIRRFDFRSENRVGLSVAAAWGEKIRRKKEREYERKERGRGEGNMSEREETMRSEISKKK